MIREYAEKAKLASRELKAIPEATRTTLLETIAAQIEQHASQIILANQKDILFAQENQLSTSMIERLKLDEKKIAQMCQAIRDIAGQAQVVGEIIETKTMPSGITLKKERIPIGVLLMIFESRPNVVTDCAALAIKSGNAILLKGGKEAKHSNEILGSLIQRAISPFVNPDSVQVLPSDKKEYIAELLQMNDLIDLVIPRGGEKLIHSVYAGAKMPVIAHYKGLCHIYVHADANPQYVNDIIVNAKVQRPGVCNAMETLLIHKDYPQTKTILEKLRQHQVELRVDDTIKALYPTLDLKPAQDSDWDEEYLDLILSVKLVGSLEEAIQHIQQHGSQHSEAILATDAQSIQKFIDRVDASCVLVNASTRFNDGGELGLGAELGISTSKLHCYGPMGAKEMTTTRYQVSGNGTIRK